MIAIRTAGALGKLFAGLAGNVGLRPASRLQSADPTRSRRMFSRVMPHVARGSTGFQLIHVTDQAEGDMMPLSAIQTKVDLAAARRFGR